MVLVAGLDGAPVGCGALRLLDPATAEVKRMSTLPTARGRGVARAILSALEAEARWLAATCPVHLHGRRAAATAGASR